MTCNSNPNPNPTSPTSLSQHTDSHLDYAQLTNPSTRPLFIQRLRQCLVGIGFFYLHNTPLDQADRRNRIFQNSQQFFRLPIELRNSINMQNSRHFRGYTKFGDERTQEKIDYRDQIDFGPESSPLPTSLTSKHKFANLIGPNQFLPAEVLPDQKEIILDWFDTCHEISLEITRALEEALGLQTSGRLLDYLVGTGEANGSESGNGNGNGAENEGESELKYARMKTIRYPTGQQVDGIERLQNGGNQGVGAHKDGGWLTLLCTSPVEGLEVQDLNGDWLSVPHVPGSIIVNFGQQIEYLSRGMINAATHRVISNRSGSDRLSVAWFATPRLDARLQELQEAEIGGEFKEICKEEIERRKKSIGNEKIKSDVKEKDLHSNGRLFGETAWEGIVRSHPNVFEKWYSSNT